MEDIIKVITDNGISVACLVFMMYYILVTQKEQNKTLDEISKTLTAIVTILGVKQVEIESAKKNLGGN